MANYHQLTLFDLKPYSSESSYSDPPKVFQIEEPSEIEYEQLELDFYPKSLRQFSIKELKEAA